MIRSNKVVTTCSKRRHRLYSNCRKRGDKLIYKDYTSTVSWDELDRCYRGVLENVGGVLVTWESEIYENCLKEFQLAVDDYLTFCNDVGISPAAN